MSVNTVEELILLLHFSKLIVKLLLYSEYGIKNPSHHG